MSEDKSDNKESRQSQPQILREYAVKISPITSEILKIISITSIFFIGAGFIDMIMYVYKNNTVLPLSFLSPNDLTILIILPILLSIIIVILPFIFSMLVYTALKEDYGGIFDFIFHFVFIILIISIFTYLFHIPYNIIKGHYFWVYLGSIIILSLFSLIIFIFENKNLFVKYKGAIENLENSAKNKLKIIRTIIIICLAILILSIAYYFLIIVKPYVDYILFVLSQLFFFAIVFPLSFYILEYSSPDIKRDFSFLLTFFYGLVVAIFVIYLILYKPSASFRMLTIGGNIPVKLEVSKKYLKKIDFNETAKSKLNKSLCKLQNNSKWVKFILFLKTPNNYHVKCEKDKFSPVFLIPVKYVYSEKFIQNKQKKPIQSPDVGKPQPKNR